MPSPERTIVRAACVLLTSMVTSAAIAEPTPPAHLQAFLAGPEPSYSWRIADRWNSPEATTFVVDMVSQQWLTEKEVDRPEWRHWLLVTKPTQLRHSDTAILVIAGGSNDEPPPERIDRRVQALAALTGAVVAQLQQVPNDPLTFNNDGKPRREDDLIAYAGRQFLKTGDPRWVARYPMVKSGIRAMDTVQAVLRGEDAGALEIEKFIVMGGSKRGWTSWLVAAMDRRVRAVVPMVIDCLNVAPSMRHHFGAYGFWAPALGDYEHHGLLDLTATDEFEALIAADDPYRFRDLLRMPKYIVNSTGDQYFLPDSSQFYFDDLTGEKHLSYVANTNHSLDDSDAVERIGAFCQAILTDSPRPEYSWQFAEDGSIVVNCRTRPAAVRMWQANNPTARDFRLQTIGPAYESKTLQPDANGRYVALMPEVKKGWTAYFVELEFAQADGPPLKFTTGVRVAPDVLPFAHKLEPESDDRGGDAGTQAPADAYLPGEDKPYYGTVDRWNRRFFEDHADETYGRNAQRQLLHIQEGRVAEAIANCRESLANDADDLEALFNLTVAHCVNGDVETGWQTCQRALDAGLPLERFVAGPQELLQPLHTYPRFTALAEDVNLVHGPMLGCVGHDSARFWVRTWKPAEVQVQVEPAIGGPRFQASTKADPARDYTAVVEVRALASDTLHVCTVVIDGELVDNNVSARFRTHPLPSKKARFRVAFGGGALYSPQNERMWDVIANYQPAACFLLGDNVYIDLPEQAGPLHDYTYYRRQSRPEFRRLVASTPIYAIWDDHDCAIDDCFMGPFADKPGWKRSMWEVFRNNWNNPGYGSPPEWPGCWFKTSIANVDFFFLDGRFYRTHPDAENPSMLGPVQKKWLFDALRSSRARFKVILSPVPFAEGAKESRDTWRGYPEERAEIFQFLSDNRIDGVVLVAADRHRSDAWRIERKNDYPLYEFQSSCLTHEKHNFAPLMPGALIGYNDKCSFGLLTFDTVRSDPTVTYEIVSIDDETVGKLEVRLSEISKQ